MFHPAYYAYLIEYQSDMQSQMLGAIVLNLPKAISLQINMSRSNIRMMTEGRKSSIA